MEEEILNAIIDNMSKEKDMRKIAIETLKKCTKQNFSRQDITDLTNYINHLANNIALDSSVFVIDLQSS